MKLTVPFITFLLALISKVTCSFEINCSAGTPSELRIREGDAKLVLDKARKIWNCGRENMNFKFSYESCIDKLNLPSDYTNSLKLLNRDSFVTEIRFKTELERIGEDNCNQSTYLQPYKATVRGGSFDDNDDTVTYVIIGVVVVIVVIIIAFIIYKRNKATEIEKSGYGVDMRPNTAPVNTTYPSVTPNTGPSPYQHSQTVTPVANPYVAPNSFETAPPSYHQSIPGQVPQVNYDLKPRQN